MKRRPRTVVLGLTALMNAALKDFPNPPAKTRRVNIEIPR
jgi:hypothetical protein